MGGAALVGGSPSRCCMALSEVFVHTSAVVSAPVQEVWARLAAFTEACSWWQSRGCSSEHLVCGCQGPAGHEPDTRIQ